MGDRIQQQQLEDLIKQQNNQLLIAEIQSKDKKTIIACIGLTYLNLEFEIGTFCIAPHWQNQGIGKHVLAYAESYSQAYVKQQQAELNYYVMWVLNVRNELIEYYERRGYVQTGEIEAYPVDANVGQPIVDLHLIKMKKSVVI
ncbi:GNAT family N-acetyltransferase [Acinetobacter silvestris]|uniref:GNAT family N-acetyltransferase n=1 Tax=Acinetobacter silvestris TaxID=1977882 RepID=UPI003D9C1D66